VHAAAEAGKQAEEIKTRQQRDRAELEQTGNRELVGGSKLPFGRTASVRRGWTYTDQSGPDMDAQSRTAKSRGLSLLPHGVRQIREEQEHAEANLVGQAIQPVGGVAKPEHHGCKADP
jgi:hypothetical protein